MMMAADNFQSIRERLLELRRRSKLDPPLQHDWQAVRHDINAAMAALESGWGTFPIDGIHLILDNSLPGTSRNT